jgi:outer membrane protein TolC
MFASGRFARPAAGKTESGIEKRAMRKITWKPHGRQDEAQSGARIALRSAVYTVAFASALVVPRSAHALQPLDAFLARSEVTNPDVRVSVATARQREAEADRATGALLPSVQAQGTYTRNQYEVSFPASLVGGTGSLTILPQNQFDGSFTLTVPIVDVGAWDRRAAARATFDSSSADLSAIRLDVSRRVARAYYQLVANEAVFLSAQHSLLLSRDTAALTATKRAGGTASDLDVQRAKGDVARAQQDVATATLNVATGRRSLESLTGLTPEPATQFPADDLHEEAPLDAWLAASEHQPSVESAVAARRSAEDSACAAQSAWLPTLTGTAQERLTNAPSITLHNEYYLLQITAAWKVDATVPAEVRAQHAAAEVALARADATQRQIDDAIFDDWQEVRSSIDRARAARAQVEAASQAVSLARDRYEGGVATQLDVLQAQQDLFRADVTRIQADADLSYARASLRLDTARPIGDPHR